MNWQGCMWRRSELISLNITFSWKEWGQKVKLLLSTTWRHVGSGKVAPLIHKLDTRWRRVFSFKTRSFYPQNITSVPTEWGGAGAEWAPWADLGGFGEEKVLVSTEPQITQPLSRRCTDYTIPAPEILKKNHESLSYHLVIRPQICSRDFHVTAMSRMFQCFNLEAEERHDNASSEYAVKRPQHAP